jgi:hypothetical protein
MPERVYYGEQCDGPGRKHIVLLIFPSETSWRGQRDGSLLTG